MNITVDPAIIEQAPDLAYEYRVARQKDWTYYPSSSSWAEVRTPLKAPFLVATLPDTVPPDTHLAMHDGILRPTLDSDPKIYLEGVKSSDRTEPCWDEYAECWTVKSPHYDWTARTNDPGTTIILDNASGWPITKENRPTFEEAYERKLILRGKCTKDKYRVARLSPANPPRYAILLTPENIVYYSNKPFKADDPIPAGYKVE
jgi:hypothetical protein